MPRMQIYHKRCSFGRGLKKKDEGEFQLQEPFFHLLTGPLIDSGFPGRKTFCGTSIQIITPTRSWLLSPQPKNSKSSHGSQIVGWAGPMIGSQSVMKSLPGDTGGLSPQPSDDFESRESGENVDPPGIPLLQSTCGRDLVKLKRG